MVRETTIRTSKVITNQISQINQITETIGKVTTHRGTEMIHNRMGTTEGEKMKLRETTGNLDHVRGLR